MPSLSSNISSVLDLCNSPSTQAYPNILGKTARIIGQQARMMMREARLSGQNQYLRFLTLNSPTKETSIASITDPDSVCTVELVVDSTNDVRADVAIVGRLDLNIKEAEGAYACARFGRPTTMRFTWNPAESADTIYVGYETLPTDAARMGDIISLPESFHDCLEYGAAAIVKETILGEVCTPVFLATMREMKNQWREWAKRDAEERPVQRPGFGDLDFEDSMAMGW